MSQPSQGHKRPGWDEYFMQVAEVVARRSTCLRRNIGAVIVKDKRILATGYNGAPTGLAHCTEVGCLREKLGIPSGERHEICRGLHAEQNALIQAAKYGIAVEGSTIYSTTEPCSLCAKMLINAGINRIVYRDPYPDDLSRLLLSEAGVTVERFTRDASD
ncbi:MAG: cytidine/deoxycytidylate deaminase family protein [Candidatus Fermentithermobacillus carboniphilus]|uniref:Cytidine/deoxycytidylate deaminase family protein n=1 Tax=Candidatus Fermentithermobacillus carboniphilus TaxID=3085328 RepID=A0AAT9LAX0_9FIRM|nr:MAG: cytidine/deoxycytidylate deaminase family protein [Candidatus Fermentithermobacillus carboniphilus]